MEKETEKFVNFTKEIDEVEEYFQRIQISNEVSYDATFHRVIIEKYTKLIREIMSSDLSDLNKSILIESLKMVFE